MKTFSKLKEWIEKTKEEARRNGYVETEFGRRRYLPNIKASNYMVRSGAERAAINFPIQGLAADIMKLAMLRVEEELLSPRSSRCSTPGAPGVEHLEDPKLELQIHDELIVEVDEKKAEEFGQKMKEVMESVYKLKVPLVVEVSVGKNWGEL